MELKAMMPEEFLERAGGDEEEVFLFVQRGTYEEVREIRDRYGYGEEGTTKLSSLQLHFREAGLDPIQVYDRVHYGEYCMWCKEHHRIKPVQWPIVDKRLDLVFDCDSGGHGVLIANLYGLHTGTNDGPVPGLLGDDRTLSMYGKPGLSEDRVDPAREYIVNGYGYAISSVSGYINSGRPAFAISKKLFDHGALDKYDEAIMKDREIKVAEDFFV